MNGVGFKSFVKIGDSVKSGQKLIEFDLDLVKQNAKSEITPVVVTNMEKLKSFRLTKDSFNFELN
jgi:phosphotransferase system IIA component